MAFFIANKKFLKIITRTHNHPNSLMARLEFQALLKDAQLPKKIRVSYGRSCASSKPDRNNIDSDFEFL